MALIKPLKLRSEKVAAKQNPAKDRPYVSVIVDTRVFHLDQPYSYIVPEVLTDKVEVGSLIKVPFGRAITEGIVIERNDGQSISGLKFVEGIISKFPIVTLNQISLFQTVAARYGSSVWDVMRLALPSYSPAGEKKYSPSANSKGVVVPTLFVRKAFTVHHEAEIIQFLSEVKAEIESRRILVIAPDEKTLEALSPVADVTLSSSATKSESFLNYLKANNLESGLIIGLRSSVFIDLRPQDLLVVISDSDANHYERHVPTYNSRDVALLRAQQTNIVFIGFTHSLEIARLINKGYLTHESTSPGKRKVFSESPDREYGYISEALKKGSVLIVHANAGYVKSFACNNCRNIAACYCGSRLELLRESKGAICGNCGWKTNRWVCTYCASEIPRVLGRGVERRAEDYGRSFPRIRIIHSSGEHPVANLPEGNCIVVSTPGMEPSGEYAAVLLLDGDQIFGRVGLRSDEQGELWWSRAASLVASEGVLYISLPSAHPISQSFIRGSFDKLHTDQILQRSSAKLPPDYRVLVIEGSLQELMGVRNFIEAQAFEEPLTILGPTVAEKTRLVIKYPVELGSSVTSKTYEMNRVRSLQGLKPLRVGVDPFDFI